MLTYLLNLSKAPTVVQKALKACPTAVADVACGDNVVLVKLDTNSTEGMNAVEKEAYAEVLRWVRSELNFREQLPQAVIIEIT